MDSSSQCLFALWRVDISHTGGGVGPNYWNSSQSQISPKSNNFYCWP